MLETLSCATFRPHIDEAFTIRVSDSEALDATLIEASEVGTPPAESEDRRQAFALLFRTEGELERHVSQGIRVVEHTTLGTLEIFLVPIGPDEVGMRYEAMFS